MSFANLWFYMTVGLTAPDSGRVELDGSDVYTLRRIVPKDRGLSWGDK